MINQQTSNTMDMDIREEAKKKKRELEELIAERGIGSQQLKKAQRAQRDLNLALALGSAAVLIGVSAWIVYKTRGE
jgi:cell division septum initiation protein DivIVA